MHAARFAAPGGVVINQAAYLSIFAAALLFATAPADLATANDLPITGSIGIGIANIYGKEKVFDGGSKISELDWTSRNVPILRGALGFDLGDGWKIKAEGNVAVNGGGEMTDYDWIAPFATDSSKNGWSHRSIHPDTKLDHYFDGRIELSKRIYGDETQSVFLGAGAKYSDVKWTASGGSFVYSVGGPRDRSGDFADGERGITYQQKIPVVYAALGGEQQYDRVTLSGVVQVGAAIQARGVDDHWMRDLRFVDELGLSPAYSAKAGLGYALTESMSLYLDGEVEKIDFKRGDTRVKDTVTGSTASFEDAGGGNFAAIQIGFGIRGSF